MYLGVRAFNARRSAENFAEDDLPETVSWCRERGVKVYLTMNTLVFDHELKQITDTLALACEAGVDGIIVQDLAVAALARRHVPSLPLHGSTQMSIHNAEGARFLREQGFVRVVLARELSEGEIRAIAQAVDMELECFVHGALCMCVSGQCTLSAMIGGRSGNRGMCAQPCRLPFAGGVGSHSLSLRDLSLVDQIPRLQAAGVTSLKIEGRMKRPEYVAAATTACRQALRGEPVDHRTLEAVFSRSGFTHGYFTGQRGKEMFGTRQKEDVTAAAPEVLRGLQGLYRNETGRIPLSFRLTLHRDRPVRLEVSDREGHTVQVEGEPPQEAISAPTTPEKAGALLEKTGGTPYRADRVECDIQEGLMAPSSRINGLRREALGLLSQQRRAAPPHPFDPAPDLLTEAGLRSAERAQQIRVRLHRAEQMSRELAAESDLLILPLSQLLHLPEEFFRSCAGTLVVELPRMLFDGQKKVMEQLEELRNRGITRVLAGNPGAVVMAREAGMTAHGDFGLNVTNTLALEEYRRAGLEDVTLSFESDLKCINALGGAIPRGILAWGYLPLMLLRNCPVKAGKGCKSCRAEGGFPELIDRKDSRFFLDCGGTRATTLYNREPLFLADRLPELQSLDFLTLYFTRESQGECLELTRLYRRGGPGPEKKTRGLYYRGVQ